MRKLLIFIIGVVFGSVSTGAYVYHEIFLVWSDSQARLNESEIKLFNIQIAHLREGKIEDVVAYFKSEIEVRQNNLKQEGGK